MLLVSKSQRTLHTRPSVLDQRIFYFDKLSQVIGVIILFVDNLTRTGKSTFSNTIEKFRKIFHVGTENSETFTYVGFNIDKTKSVNHNQSTKSH